MRLFVVRSEYVVCRRARVTRDTNKDKERRRREKGEKNFSFKIQNTKFLLLRNFFLKLEFHHNLFFVYICLYYNKEEKKKFSFQG